MTDWEKSRPARVKVHEVQVGHGREKDATRSGLRGKQRGQHVGLRVALARERFYLEKKGVGKWIIDRNWMAEQGQAVGVWFCIQCASFCRTWAASAPSSNSWRFPPSTTSAVSWAFS